MRFLFVLFLVFTFPLKAQLIISQKHLDYFEISNISNGDYRNRVQCSVSFDEFAWSIEKFKINDKIYSFGTSLSYKRMLPNIGKFWTPQTIDWQRYFPQNGFTVSAYGRKYFNLRKFAFTGLRLYGGYFFTNETEMYNSIFLHGPSAEKSILEKTRSYRTGIDAVIGRKFLNKAISEIEIRLGWRFDVAEWTYYCSSGCISGNTNTPETSKEINGMIHFQIVMGFDIFRD